MFWRSRSGCESGVGEKVCPIDIGKASVEGLGNGGGRDIGSAQQVGSNMILSYSFIFGLGVGFSPRCRWKRSVSLLELDTLEVFVPISQSTRGL